jgi:uncharacterized protein (TIGR02996 family)
MPRRFRLLFPDPVYRLPGEYGFVLAVLATPLDDLPKLVYADWLDEHDDPRGAFLRAWVAARHARSELPKPDESLSECWLAVVGYELDSWLAELGNPTWIDAIRTTAQPCVVARTIRLEEGETVPPGGSKTGGVPDLAPDDEWPEGGMGRSAFVAHWNLEELAISPCSATLPKAGLLSFFLDLVPWEDGTENNSARVHFTRSSRFVRERIPDDLPAVNALPACRVEFREWLSIPDHRSPTLRSLLPRNLRGEYHRVILSFPLPVGSHQILGHFTSIHDDPTPEGKKGPWSLFTQLGPDANLLFDSCDNGMWYFMTPTTSLVRGAFEDVRSDFQTG